MSQFVSRAEVNDILSKRLYERVNPSLIASVQNAVQALFPVVSDDKKTEVRASRVWVDDSGFDPESLHDQQDARQRGKTPAASVRANLELWRDGKQVQALPKFELGKLPLMNRLGTFMVSGNDYFVPLAQLRLKPGAYTREQANGEFETFIPMRGAQMSVWIDPARGVLKIGIYDSNVSWYAITKALGASDEELAQALGEISALASC